MLSRFHRIPERGGQTDGWTELLHQSRVSMLTRDKNAYRNIFSPQIFPQDHDMN